MQAPGPQRSLNAQINITPLIDIVLVLLIVFIVMVPVLTRQHDVSIPADGKGGAPGTPLVLTVLKDGGFQLQRDTLAGDALVARLAEALRGQDGQDRKVFVKVDGGQPFQRTVDALDLVRRASDRAKAPGDRDAAVAISVTTAG